MISSEAESTLAARKAHQSSWLRSTAAVVAAALMMVWPAFFNGFPLLYPDSMTYITDGHLVARALFLHQYSAYYGMRSFIYSLGILPLHWDVSPWPVVALQSLITAYVLWLLVRCITPSRARTYFLFIAALLSIFTTLGWYVSLVMPDILGPLMYLAVYLLIFARGSLSRTDRWALMAIIWWSAASHITHLMLVVGLCGLLSLLVLLRAPLRVVRLKAIAEVGLVLLVSAGATMALHAFLYGKPSLNGERPPYLMARIIADGPGRLYLEQNCSHLQWAICDSVHQLPSNADEFLWGPDGVWDSASEDRQQQMLTEEMPLVIATLKTYPRQQIAQSTANVIAQLKSYGIEDFDRSSWVLDQFTTVMPTQRMHYFNSRQQTLTLPLDFITSLQDWVVVISLVLITGLSPLLWKLRATPLLWLAIVVFAILLANAFLSGTLSMVDDRYQARVIWLLPLLALSCVVQSLNFLLQRREARA